MTNSIGVVGVIGAGAMGTGIAQVALEAGWDVRLHDADPSAAERGRDRVRTGLRRRAEKGDLGPAWAASRAAALTLTDTAAAAAAGADLVIEAIVEDLGAKRALFATLDAAAGPGTILATNTSALSVAAIAEAARRHPGRVLGLHFFNPAPVMLLVEVVPAPTTDPLVVATATAVVEAWGKTPVRSADRPGFIVNRVNRPFTIEALRMLEAGEARVAEIDAAIRADGFRMGPFELMDLVGLDVNLAAATAVWEGLGRPDRLRPSPIQAWLVDHRRLGRKTERGFYQYGREHDPAPDPLPHHVVPPVRVGRTLSPDRIVQRIRTAIAREAIAARDEDVATEPDIDTALWLGAAHPEGPFAWRRRHDPTIAP
ncbi:MAG TPA: 3-hydroxyacyl-CoA dehydrogenase NAD-binding domain-containing protein [Candidatus Limnocylindrales bacterium]|nr:3-hydroxyacyl-CoA dehydrogenase NAD-binding domain-containing protein [Candidatus Limnocylindrales bacterium]